MRGAADVTDAQSGRGAFVHRAFLYRTQQEYLDRLLPFISEAVEADQRCSSQYQAQIWRCWERGWADWPPRGHDRHDRGGTQPRSDPWRGAEQVRRQASRRAGSRDRRTDVADSTEVEYPACVQHEALLNRAFTGRDVTVVCPYDVSQLDPDVIADAHRTHPVLWQDGVFEASNPAYAPEAMWARYNQPLSSDPSAVRYTARKLGDLAGARAFAGVYAQWFGLSPDQTADLQLITSELATVEPDARRWDVPARALAA